MADQLRLTQIITGLSPGGAERSLLRILTQIDRSAFRVQVISLTTKGPVGLKIEALGIPVSAMGFTPGRISPWEMWRLVRLLKAQDPDIVHTWMYHSDLVGGIAARLAGCRSVGWSLHNSNLSRDKNKLTTLMVVHLCAPLSRLIPKLILSCSDKAKDVHVAAGFSSSKMRVIPNGFDLQEFHYMDGARETVRQELGLDPDTRLVGLFARYDPQKNHLGFLEAARQVRLLSPNSHFIMAGSGISRENLVISSAVSTLGLEGCVHLLGHREDVPRLLSALDVLASSSDGEAFPNVLGEAMACSVPCVTTDAGDSAKIVGDTGFVCPVGNMTKLAQEIVKVLDMPAAKRATLGGRALSRIKEQFELRSIVRRYEHFYEELHGVQKCAE